MDVSFTALSLLFLVTGWAYSLWKPADIFPIGFPLQNPAQLAATSQEKAGQIDVDFL